MRESRTYGYVRGQGCKALVYSTHTEDSQYGILNNRIRDEIWR